MNHQQRHLGCTKMVVLGLLVCWLGGFPVDAQAQVRRFALVLGANQGGQGRTNLHYATRDADLVAGVLTRLGGVAREDLIVLRDVTAATVETAWEGLRVRLQQARDRGQRVEVFFYYSGHSDEQGLLVQGDRIPYRRVREVIKSLPAQVRVAVLDSCASGVLTRGKGGVRGAPFLIDVATKVKGHAFVASASADEVAQESERLRGSFFTHHFVAGLRGAADADRDRRVTLNEAYQYAFNATLAQTESSRSGAQHANYDMRLAGSGGLVLTDLRATAALLVFAPELQGQLYVRDAAGNLVVEVRKHGKHPLSLALDPGRYDVRMTDGTHQLVGTFELARGKQAAVARGDLQQAQVSAHRAKGSVPVIEPTHLIGASYVGTVGFSSAAAFGTEQTQDAFDWRFVGDLEQDYAHGAELRYLHRLGPLYLGLTGGYRRSGHTYTDRDAFLAQAYAYRYEERGDAEHFYALLSTEWHVPTWRWLRPAALWRWIRPLVGVDFGAGYVHQTMESSGTRRLPMDATTDELERLLEDPSGRAVSFRENSWTRSLPAVHTRMRLGLAVPVHDRVRIEALGHFGFEISAAHLDDGDQRIDEVDPGSPFVPRLGFSLGLVLAL